jgi:amidohydrolase
MVQEGVMDRFSIGQVYGIHNAPNVPFGKFQTTPGPLMASVDTAVVKVTGKGGHGATPHECVDPVVAIVAMVQAVQTIIPRNVYALDEAVISVTMIHTGTASNIIPEDGTFTATIRCFKPDVRALLKKRFHEIVEGHAQAFGVKAVVDYDWGYPATINHEDEAAFAAGIASEIVGPDLVDGHAGREMGSEDFSYMLEARPGAYLFLGTGPGAGLHHAAFDFNDEASPIGASFFARLVEKAQPLGG